MSQFESAFTLLESSASQTPNSPVVIDSNGSYSYAALLEDSLAVTKLLQNYVPTPGHGIALTSSDLRSFLAGLFGTLNAGQVAIPSQGPDENLSLYQTALIAPHIPNAACVRFTSGTTGAQKGAVLTHKNILDRVRTVQRSLQIKTEERVLFSLPMQYHFVASLMVYVANSATILFPQSDSPDDLVSCINEFKPDLLFTSPTALNQLANQNIKKFDNSLSRIIFAGESLASSKASRIREILGKSPRPFFGAMEVGLPLGRTDWDGEELDPLNVLPGYEAQVLSKGGEPLPPDTVGLLAFAGEGIFAGYINPNKTSKEILLNGKWFVSGDLARMNQSGAITVLGRATSAFETNGKLFVPEDLERQLQDRFSLTNLRISFRKNSSLVVEILEQEGVNADSDLVDQLHLLTGSSRNNISLRRVSAIPITATGKIARAES